MKNVALLILFSISLVACNQPETKQETSKKKEQETTVDTTKAQSVPKRIQQSAKEGNAILPPQGDRAASMQYYNEGVRLYAAGDIDAAFDQFRIALEANPKSSEINHYLGRIYYDKGEKELAMSYYEDAVKSNVYDSVSILGIGQIYFDMGDTENAMKYYNMSIEVAPNFALAYYNRGTLLGMQKMLNSSLQDLDKSIELDPTNGNAYVNRGLAYYYAKEMEKACENWQIAADMGVAKGIEAVRVYCK